MGDEARDAVLLDFVAVAAGAKNFNVPAAELRGFEDRLTATSAWRDRLLARQIAGNRTPGNRNASHLIEPERMLRCGQRALLGADAEPIAGVFHVCPCDHLPIDTLDRAADVETGVGGIRLERGGTGQGDESVVVHADPSSAHAELVEACFSALSASAYISTGSM